MDSPILTANAWKPANGVGAILGTGFGCVALGLATTHRPTPDWALPLALGPFAVAVLLGLVRSNAELDGETRTGRLGRGVWPLVFWRQIDFSGPSELRVEGARGNYGWQLFARLAVPDSGLLIPIVSRGGELEVEPALRWARRHGIRVSVDGALRRAPEETMRRLLPELFDGD